MKILNLTQHDASAEQISAGVIECVRKEEVKTLLTFDRVPSLDDMVLRASILASFAGEQGCKYALIGGAPFFMSTLEKVLLAVGVTPCYSFALRDSKEVKLGDGSSKKVSFFKHQAFYFV